MEVIIWLAVFWGEGSNDVFKEWGFWFAVKQGSDVGVNVSVRGKVDVFPLGSVDGVVDSEGEFEVMVEDVVGGEEGKCVIEWGMDAPKQGVNLPA